ncbi:MAG: AEC family transporter [Silicimonas sp.]|nr:AEC family transporter [Silicimonas sp.]
MQALLEIILPVFVVIGFGYIVAWKGLFEESAVDGLVRFTQNFAIPCLLFRAISVIELGAITNVPLIFSFYIGAFASFFLGYAGAKAFFDRSSTDAVAIGFCCFFSNTILLGLPITERAYGPDALVGNFAIIAFHAPLLYFVGVTAMELFRNQGSSLAEKASSVFGAMFRNPFVIAIALGLAVNITSLPLPSPVIKGVDLIANAALPAALFGLGGLLVRYKPEGDLKTILMVCVISLVLHPAIVFAVGTATALDQSSMRSAVLTASMAPGVNTYVFANLYGSARRVAAASVLIATAASIVSVWFWLLILP